MTPTPLERHTPFLMPSPLRANTSATYAPDGSAMASPVGITARSPAFSVTGASTQACRSMAAEPAVANCGRGISRPIFGFTALNFTSIGVILSKNDYK